MQHLPQRSRLQGLEGVRGYAFLVVFLVHYSTGLSDSSVYIKSHVWAYPWLLFIQSAWMAVPIFFVLSGFLITGILYDTQGRTFFFRVFYGRRALRILPLYYLAVGGVGVLTLLSHSSLSLRYLSYFPYLQNMHRQWGGDFGHFLTLSHLWSLAVEEQFYLVWPLVIWLIRRREWLLRISYAVIAAEVILRVFWPSTGLSYGVAYYSTFTRSGALMLGAVLALHQRAPAMKMDSLARPAKLILAFGFALILAKVAIFGNALPFNYSGVAFLIPLTDLMSAAVVVLAILPGNVLHHWCLHPWAVALGNLSYGLYVFHFIAHPFFYGYLPVLLRPLFGSVSAKLLSAFFAFSVTVVASIVSYYLIELPCMRNKDRLQYGDVREGGTEPIAQVADGASSFVRWISSESVRRPWCRRPVSPPLR